jgi:hypothetical protein
VNPSRTRPDASSARTSDADSAPHDDLLRALVLRRSQLRAVERGEGVREVRADAVDGVEARQLDQAPGGEPGFLGELARGGGGRSLARSRRGRPALPSACGQCG